MLPQNIFGSICASAYNCCGAPCFHFSTKCSQIITARYVPHVHRYSDQFNHRLQKKEFTVLFKMAQCIAFTGEFAGNTAFALESTHFKHENLVKHGESAKHKKCRDKCVAKKSGSIIKAFNNGAR